MEEQAGIQGRVDDMGRRVMSIALAIGSLLSGCDGGSSAGSDAAMPHDGSADAAVELDASTDGSSDARDDVAVTIAFRAKVGDQDFACDQTYEGVGASSNSVRPVDLRFFVSDVVLLRADDGAEVPVELDVRGTVQNGTVALLDFEDATGSCAGTTETNVVVTGMVPRGSYRGLAFTNGVPPDLNHENPIRLMAPLREGSMHWGWQGGFLFVNASVQQAVDEGEAGSATLHLGSTECAGDPRNGYQCAKSNRNRIVLPEFDVEEDHVVFDVAALFGSADLTQTTTCHSHGEELCGAFFEAAGVHYATGEARETPSIYRVER